MNHHRGPDRSADLPPALQLTMRILRPRAGLFSGFARNSVNS